jgi:hypothetical protein
LPDDDRATITTVQAVMIPRHKLQDLISYPPRGLRADRAAAYLGISKTKFLELVDEKCLPRPKVIDGIRVWDRLALDSAFSDLPEWGDDGERNGRRNTFDVITGQD